MQTLHFEGGTLYVIIISLLLNTWTGHITVFTSPACP